MKLRRKLLPLGNVLISLSLPTLISGEISHTTKISEISWLNISNSLFSSPTIPSSGCQNVKFSNNKCQYVHDYCDLENFGIVNYLSLYYCSVDNNNESTSISKLISLSVIILWLCILFMTIGIAAYDFLCPNLSTIANILGLAESVIGVTFLAFGNGSPDMFSTYAAVRIGSGSLAIGELIGAATFIIAVVAGSMAVINPFRVSRKPFIRDMTFFTIAVSFSLYFISDGLLQPWECMVMLLLYVIYGGMVVYWQMVHNKEKDDEIDEMLEERLREEVEQQEEQQQQQQQQYITSSNESVREGEGEEAFEYFEPVLEQDHHAQLKIQKQILESDENSNSNSNPNPEEQHNTKHLHHHNPHHPYHPQVHSELRRQSDPQNYFQINPQPSSQVAPSKPRLNSRSHTHPPRPHLLLQPSANSIRSSRYSPRNSPRPVASPKESPNLSPNPQRPPLSSPRSASSQRSFSQFPKSPIPKDEESQVSEITRIMRINRRTKDYHSIGEDYDDRSYRHLLLHSNSNSRPTSPDSYLSSHSHSTSSRSRSRSRSHSQSNSHLQSYSQSRTHSRSPSPIPPVRSSFISAVEFHNLAAKISSKLTTIDDPQRTISYDRAQAQPSPLRLSVRTLSSPYIPITSTKTSTKTIPSLLVTDESDSPINPTQPPSTPALVRPSLTINTSLPTTAATIDTIDNIESPTAIQIIEEIEQLYDYKDQLAAQNSEVFRILFPSLSTISSKSWYNVIPSLLAVPSIFILTCTVPVFESNPNEEEFSPTEEERQENSHNQSPIWLLIVQSILSPFAVIFCIFGEFTFRLTVIGIITACFLLSSLYFRTGTSLPIISFIGFSVVIAWIATIASEVVALLKALGIIFNVSEAILGLTVFAIGNSLGDLITDITLARLGFPTMALAACFGSPLLNILVGIGMSCLVVILGPSNKRPELGRGGSYSIEVSPTLVISGATLLLTSFFLLIVVPLNNWKMSRTIGLCTISFWVISTSITIVLEFV